MVGTSTGGILDSAAWRLLLHYLPPDTSLWTEFLGRNRTLYKQFVDEMIIKSPGTPDHISPVQVK